MLFQNQLTAYYQYPPHFSLSFEELNQDFVAERRAEAVHCNRITEAVADFNCETQDGTIVISFSSWSNKSLMLDNPFVALFRKGCAQ
jgi:hypothetical protein